MFQLPPSTHKGLTVTGRRTLLVSACLTVIYVRIRGVDRRTGSSRATCPGLPSCSRSRRQSSVAITSFTELLALGDLRSDGFANEVVRIVSENLELRPALMEALASGDPVVRGHAADALEKLARQHPGPSCLSCPP